MEELHVGAERCINFEHMHGVIDEFFYSGTGSGSMIGEMPGFRGSSCTRLRLLPAQM